MENKMIVTLNNLDVTINIKEIYQNPETGNELIIYTIDDYNSNEELVSLLIENSEGIILETISDDRDREFLNGLTEK